MSMNNRRHMLGLIGAAPFAAKAVGGELGAAMAAVSNANAGQMNMAKDCVNTTSGSIGGGKPWTKEMDLLDGFRRRQRQIQEFKQRLRLSIGGIDPDIQVLRSTSANYKCAKQFEREMEVESLMDQLHKALWG